jgi:hypothetical protein
VCTSDLQVPFIVVSFLEQQFLYSKLPFFLDPKTNFQLAKVAHQKQHFPKQERRLIPKKARSHKSTEINQKTINQLHPRTTHNS